MITFDTHPEPLPTLEAGVRRPDRHARRWTCRRTPGFVRRLQAQAQLLRPRRRHRAGRRDPAHPLRASRGPRGRRHAASRSASSAPARTSSCCAARRTPSKVNFCKFTNETRLAIEDASAHSGHQVPRRAERHLRRRRLRAGARLRRDPARRRRQLGGEPARGAAARRAARHRRPDARRRQAQGAPRPRRRLRHARRRREGQARGRVAARRRGPSDQPVQGGGRSSARRRSPARVRSAGGGARHHARTRSNPTVTDARSTYSAVSLAFDRDKRTADAHRAGADAAAAVDAGGDSRGRRSVLAAARVPRARRRAAAAARRTSRRSAPSCSGPKAIRDARARGRSRRSSTHAVALARARDHALHEAHAEAPRPDGAQLLRAHRAGHRRSPARCSSWRSPPIAPTCSTMPERPNAIALSPMNAGPLPMSNGLSRLQTRFLRRAGQASTTLLGARRAVRRRRGATRPGSSRSRPTRSTGTTRCGWRSRSARRSRPTR